MFYLFIFSSFKILVSKETIITKFYLLCLFYPLPPLHFWCACGALKKCSNVGTWWFLNLHFLWAPKLQMFQFPPSDAWTVVGYEDLMMPGLFQSTSQGWLQPGINISLFPTIPVGDECWPACYRAKMDSGESQLWGCSGDTQEASARIKDTVEVGRIARFMPPGAVSGLLSKERVLSASNSSPCGRASVFYMTRASLLSSRSI